MAIRVKTETGETIATAKLTVPHKRGGRVGIDVLLHEDGRYTVNIIEEQSGSSGWLVLTDGTDPMVLLPEGNLNTLVSAYHRAQRGA